MVTGQAEEEELRILSVEFPPSAAATEMNTLPDIHHIDTCLIRRNSAKRTQLFHNGCYSLFWKKRNYMYFSVGFCDMAKNNLLQRISS